MKKILLILILLIILPIVSGLTAYQGKTLTYGVECLSNEGGRDIGCADKNVTIIDQSAVWTDGTTTFAEVSDTYLPGMWRGTYAIPATMPVGNAQLWITLMNSNGTTSATVLNVDVVYDFAATVVNVSDLEFKLDEINITTHNINNTLEDGSFNVTAISRCVWGLENPTVCGIWRTVHSWVT